MKVIVKKRITIPGINKVTDKALSALKFKVDKANKTKKSTPTPDKIIKDAKAKAAKIKKDAKAKTASIKKKASAKAAKIKKDAAANLKAKQLLLVQKKAKKKEIDAELSAAKKAKSRKTLINGLLKPRRSFARTWRDSGSGARASVTFYNMKPISGYHGLGGTGYPGYSYPVSSFKVMSLKKSNKVIDYKYPVKYKRIWKDSGSGASWDGAIWKPIPPKGYVAMGMVSTRGYSEPSRKLMVCVKSKYTKTAKVSKQLWNDKGSGANTDLSVWYNEQLGTFWAHTSHNKPKGKVLRVFDLNKIKDALK